MNMGTTAKMYEDVMWYGALANCCNVYVGPPISQEPTKAEANRQMKMGTPSMRNTNIPMNVHRPTHAPYSIMSPFFPGRV
jgi:hypothetical protein